MDDRLKILLFDRGHESIKDEAGLRALLDARIDEAQWVWPDIQGKPDAFVRYIADRLPPDTKVEDALRRMKISDLYLAWGCTVGDEAALNAFSTHFDEMVSGSLRRFANQGLDTDDAKQKVMEFILLPSAKRAAAIHLYAGHGSLKGYLGVTIVREVLRMLKAAKKAPAIDLQDPANAFANSDHDPELQLLKTKYRSEFKLAFQEAFQSLEPLDRNMLRYYYVTDLTLMQIATITGVKHNTVSRRLAKIRSSLLSGTRDRLINIAGIRHGEFESIVRLVQSQLNVSMYRMLKSESDGEVDR